MHQGSLDLITNHISYTAEATVIVREKLKYEGTFESVKLGVTNDVLKELMKYIIRARFQHIDEIHKKIYDEICAMDTPGKLCFVQFKYAGKMRTVMVRPRAIMLATGIVLPLEFNKLAYNDEAILVLYKALQDKIAVIKDKL